MCRVRSPAPSFSPNFKSPRLCLCACVCVCACAAAVMMMGRNSSQRNLMCSCLLKRMILLMSLQCVRKRYCTALQLLQRQSVFWLAMVHHQTRTAIWIQDQEDVRTWEPCFVSFLLPAVISNAALVVLPPLLLERFCPILPLPITVSSLRF